MAYGLFSNQLIELFSIIYHALVQQCELQKLMLIYIVCTVHVTQELILRMKQ